MSSLLRKSALRSVKNVNVCGRFAVDLTLIPFCTRRSLQPDRSLQRQDFNGRSVLIVGGRSSAVDIARELRSRAGSLYVLATWEYF